MTNDQKNGKVLTWLISFIGSVVLLGGGFFITNLYGQVTENRREMVQVRERLASIEAKIDFLVTKEKQK